MQFAALIGTLPISWSGVAGTMAVSNGPGQTGIAVNLRSALTPAGERRAAVRVQEPAARWQQSSAATRLAVMVLSGSDTIVPLANGFEVVP